jgi:predicted nucleic acid-binding protein
VALFHKRDQFHPWVKSVLNEKEFKFVTCESVLTETLFISKNAPLVVDSISGMIEKEILEIRSAVSECGTDVFELMSKYHDQNTSLADTSLVLFYNQQKAPIFTIDSDFLIYRDSKGNPLELITPYKS